MILTRLYALQSTEAAEAAKYDATFDDVPHDCFHEIIEDLMKQEKTWCSLNAISQVNKELRQILRMTLMFLPKWNNLLQEKGKVRLDRLAVICSFPELREKATRFMTGKTKFVFHDILYQLNHPKDIHSLLVHMDHGTCTLRWTDEENARRGPAHGWRYDEAYGSSIRFKSNRRWNHGFINTDIDIVQAGFNMICKLKQDVVPSAMKKEMKTLFEDIRTLHSHIEVKDNTLWSEKHKRNWYRIDETTLLDYYKPSSKNIS